MTEITYYNPMDCKENKVGFNYKPIPRVVDRGSQYCQECMPDETSWLVPVKTIPDPFMMDRHHAYILPDNKIYVLSEDRTKAILLGGLGGEDNSNFVINTELETKLRELREYIDNQNNSQEYRAGAGIVITPDKEIISQVTPQDIDRVGETALEAKDKAELALNKASYDDTDVKQRLSALEAKTDKDTIFDDTKLKERLDLLEKLQLPKKFVTYLENGKDFNIPHPLNTEDFTWSLWENNEGIVADVTVIDADNINIKFTEEILRVKLVLLG